MPNFFFFFFPPSNLLGRRLTCPTGEEDSLLDCDSDYSGVTGWGLGTCQGEDGDQGEVPGILCDQVRGKNISLLPFRGKGLLEV